ncbi:hypothetical protein CU098_013798 [Rhizopus stolonifer]|uniref:Uncharacterized protein n=1 Tax=Rhizopus stolonifer TaxID=4846 RepID=A0A367KWR3_RHIST|nr:hypothetical protein CU098_013798 [Rhizopus stolonifer]
MTTRKNKLTSESRDLLATKDLLQAYCQKALDDKLLPNTKEARQKRALTQPRLEELMNKMIASFSGCLSIVDFDGDIDASKTEPINEELRQKIKSKEQELDAVLLKAIDMRRTVPQKQLNIAQEISAVIGQQAEKAEFKVISDEKITTDTVEAYRDTIRLSKHILKASG